MQVDQYLTFQRFKLGDLFLLIVSTMEALEVENGSQDLRNTAKVTQQPYLKTKEIGTAGQEER